MFFWVDYHWFRCYFSDVLCLWQVPRMTYMEPHMLGWRPLMLSWVNTLHTTVNVTHKDLITALFDRLPPACLQLIRKATKVLNHPREMQFIFELVCKWMCRLYSKGNLFHPVSTWGFCSGFSLQKCINITLRIVDFFLHVLEAKLFCVSSILLFSFLQHCFFIDKCTISWYTQLY